MFVKNEVNEVVNLNHVLAVRVYGDSEPYEIHLFTEDCEFVLRYISYDGLAMAMKKLMKALRKIHPRWIEVTNPNYYFRADKVLVVRDHATNVQVQMVGRNFIVYGDIKNNVIYSLTELINDKIAIMNLDEDVLYEENWR